MYKLFLDDVRVPEDVATYIYPTSLRPLYDQNEWAVVRSYREFVDHIQMHGLPGIISFDHDLGFVSENYVPRPNEPKDEQSGYDCAKWLVTYCINHKLELPDFLVHSMNPIGAKNIVSYLENFQRFQDKSNK